MHDSDKKWVKALGAAIRRRRKALGMSQAQAASLSSCQRLFVSEVERGKATVRLDKLVELMSALGLEIVVTSGKEELRIDETL